MGEQKKIRVGVDIRDLRFAKTGQKTILEEYYKQFLENTDPSIEFVFIDIKLPQPSRKYKIGIVLNHLIYQWFKQVLLPYEAWSKKVDVLFCCDYFAPLLTPGFKNVQVFYDAFFYEYPEHYNRLWMKLFKYFAIPAAKRSAFIVTISEYSKQKIHQHIHIPLEKIVCIYPGPKSLSTHSVTSKEPMLTLPSQPYILHVGVWEKRKNIPQLLKAFRMFLNNTQLNYQLVLVGNGNNRMHSDDTEAIKAAIQAFNLTESVICTGYLSDEAVAQAYSHAALYVFPSYNEGFGLPIMEAFRFNIPVIVANNSCLPEVGRNGVLTFNPYSAEDIAQKMQEVLTNPTLQASLKENGKERLLVLTWPKASNQIKEVFKNAARNGK